MMQMNWNVMVSPTNRKHVSRSMMIKAKNIIIMKERMWIHFLSSEITLQPLEPDTDTSKLHVKCVIAVQEEPSLHVNFTREMSLMKCGCNVKRVMTRSNDTDVGGTFLSRSTEGCSAREFSRCVDLFKEFKNARPNVSYRLKVNEFASLTNSDETESMSRYTGRQAQQCVERPEALENS